MTRTLDTLAFDNSYARLPGAFHERVRPTPLPAPRLLHANAEVAALLDLDAAELDHPAFAACAGGERLPAGADPVAMAYAGHQFGTYVPRLGDGRAILLGEVVNARGERWDLHLKGSGPTRWSRGFDGRSVLRSAVREYLVGEAMHGLGIPTTRALSLVTSDLPVVREQVETAAAIIRVAPTHVRFGSFEYVAWQGRPDLVRTLADYVIALHFPDLAAGEDRHARWFAEVVRRTARLLARWQAAGFNHGVMNTDNFSIIGLTLDYGPYGFLDAYDPHHACNHSDHEGRYAFGRQPAVGHWNCAALAEALASLVPEADAAAALDGYPVAFEAEYAGLMRAKLGLEAAEEEDGALIGDLLATMQRLRLDYTLAFRGLADVARDDTGVPASLAALTPEPAALSAWLGRYRARLRREVLPDGERRRRLLRVNPLYTLRTWLAQRAIERAQAGDPSELATLLDLLRRPTVEQPGRASYAGLPPDWAATLTVSCSS